MISRGAREPSRHHMTRHDMTTHISRHATTHRLRQVLLPFCLLPSVALLERDARPHRSCVAMPMEKELLLLSLMCRSRASLGRCCPILPSTSVFRSGACDDVSLSYFFSGLRTCGRGAKLKAPTSLPSSMTGVAIDTVASTQAQVSNSTAGFAVASAAKQTVDIPLRRAS